MDLGLYRKSHILDGPGYQEKFYFNSGDTGFKVFQTKFAKVGVAICWDQWFPEAARAMVLQGAEILFYPTAIGFDPQDTRLDSHDHWTRVMQGHAEANLVPLVASNRIGKEIIKTKHGNSEIIFYGNSFIAGPIGEIVASADDKDGAVHVAQFDLDKIKSKRHSWGVFRDWRPDLYKGGENNEDDEDIWLYDANETRNGGSLDNAKCKLLNWDGTNVVVAEGTIASTDSKALVHHVPLGPGCWKVWVNYVIVNAPLFHLNHEIFVLEDAIGSTVAWPTHFISFDFRTNIYG
ncbi:N-carbamoylputrescine amidase-like isoform X1 [Camellia sinensis]|uniref:N-carbamoylputrescine amidase-like isoform X1 n=2 Tax=Camellia sinensis TaxID=4442 RepID=UPI0010368E0A|nr:N-carbamoylputrescine amidase-like isoform X1 [Camellia sinensis]XP_028052447.1 N-carbamoylputrescine amidase-like isoform X2 [Camellia sinensis]XP_028052448.1 N-carbamoylputrescine amidase-like isoform X1 [Camellia sinensis]